MRQTVIAGVAAALGKSNVDTDTIIPQSWLITTERQGLGRGLFAGWRYLDDGRPNPQFILNDPRNRGASILVSGPNYGCGSSREHAVWAHLDFGIRAVIAASFGPIFFDNAARCGLALIVVHEEVAKELLVQIGGSPGEMMVVDFAAQTIAIGARYCAVFEIEPDRKAALIEGRDPIADTLRLEREIAAFQDIRRRQAPWIWGD